MMPKTNVQSRGTSDHDGGPGRPVSQMKEDRPVTTSDTSAFASTGFITISISNKKRVSFVYDSGVMERRRANVRANSAEAPKVKTTTD